MAEPNYEAESLLDAAPDLLVCLEDLASSMGHAPMCLALADEQGCGCDCDLIQRRKRAWSAIAKAKRGVK
jgi:hypothetical protein